MKRILILLMSLMLMLMFSAVSLGAIHNSWSDFTNYAGQWNKFDFPNPGGWYYIEKLAPKELPYFIATASMNSHYTNISGLIFIDDQTFAEISNGDTLFVPGRTFIKGSYRFKNNFFIGLDYTTKDEIYHNTLTVLSPGYRFNINEQGYVAVSVDFASNDATSGYSCGLDFRYYFEKSRLYGQVYSDGFGVYSPSGEGTYADFGVTFKFSDQIVAGIDASSLGGDSYYRVGFTWYTDFMTLDMAVDDNELFNNNTFYLMDMFKVNDSLKLGFHYFKPSDSDSKYAIKGIYSMGKIMFGAEYQFKNGVIPSQFAVSFYKALF